MLISGLVVRNTGSHYLVLCDDGVERPCLAKGSMRLRGIRSTSPIVIGDRVELHLRTDEAGDVYYIHEIMPRRNYIVRRAANLSKQSHILAANIDASYLICTIFAPETTTTFIDRFLANAEAYQVPTHLVFNKADTLTDVGHRYLSDLIDLYQGIGYVCHVVSAITGEGLDALYDSMRAKISLFSGHSGVGKSSLINRLVPDANLRVGQVSQTHLQGMHTTTFSQMIPLLEEGAYLIDTPGIKGFGLIEVDKAEVGHYFREMFEISSQCRFANCTHTHEPHCAVLQAVDEGKIAHSRYQSYLGILTDLVEDTKYRPEY